MLQPLKRLVAWRALTSFRSLKRNLSMRDAADLRFFTLLQHGQEKQLDLQRKSGTLSHRIEVNGVRLHFETAGEGNHILLLLPGALGSSQTDFAKQLNYYNKTDFTLIALDPRGYGQSRPPERDWPLEFLQRDADDAMELVRKLGVEKVSILGWSDGGITGMIAAAKCPDMLNKLVVWGSNAYITEKDMTLYNNIRDISKWSDGMRSPFLSLYGQKYFKEHWNKWIDAFQNYCDQKGGDICKEDLRKIKTPTLIIHGRKDPLLPLEHADYIHHNIKNSRLYIMPEGKHNLHIRYYREFNFLTEQFLKQPSVSDEDKELA